MQLTRLTDLDRPLHLREGLKFARKLSTAEAVLGSLVLPGDHHSYVRVSNSGFQKKDKITDRVFIIFVR